MNPKHHPKTAWVKIEWVEDGTANGHYLASSSINPQVKVFGSTRHRALSALERDMPRYLKWEREIDKRFPRRDVA